MSDIRIQIEPPTEDAGTLYNDDSSRASLSSLNPEIQELFHGLFPSSSSLEVDPTALWLPSGQTSPLGGLSTGGLKDPTAGDLFLGRLDVPDHFSDFGSPISSASGDLVFETGSEYSSAPPSHPSSPSLSPSLSPLDNAFNGFSLGGDDSDFSLPSMGMGNRPRSSSFSVGSSSSSDTFPDGRPRSASLAQPVGIPIHRSQPILAVQSATNSPSANLAFPFDIPLGGTLFSGVTPALNVEQPDPQLGPLTDFSFSPYPPSDISSLSPTSNHRRSTSLGGETASSSSTYLPLPTASQHGSFLQVPGHLRRSNATHRRNHTVASVHGMGRGRSVEPRDISRQGSPGPPSIHLDTSAFQLLSPNVSPTLSDSSTSPHSPASSTYSISPVSPASSTYGDDFLGSFDGSVFAANDPGIGRRNTYNGQPTSPIGDSSLVHRSLSDSAKVRKPPRLRNPYPGANVFRTEGVNDHSLDNSQQPSPLESSQSEMTLYSPGEPSSSSQDNDFKRTVASRKIVDASSKRRKHAARFECSICEQKFTARHNLTNHLNSHNGVKAYHCRYCGQRATTAAVCMRHERTACKKNPNSKKKK